MRVFIGVAASVALAATLIAATAGPSSAKKPVHHMTSSHSNASMVAKGKTLVARCQGCHQPDLAGRKGFSPSLHASGVLREYNPKTWARVLSTGVTNDNGKVRPPMPVYKMAASDAGAIYAYLKTLK